jgi:hypothetical protein
MGALGAGGAVTLEHTQDISERLTQKVQIVAHVLDGRIEFVRNSGSELTDRLEFLRLPKLHLYVGAVGDGLLELYGARRDRNLEAVV